MILISHRGNLNGRLPEWENQLDYIDKAIQQGYDVEVDIWKIDNRLLLGHDEPQYEVDLNWINNRGCKLWIHCKNLEILEFFNTYNHDLNYFWHETDTAVLTSKNFIWAYPGKQPVKNSVAVMPELYTDSLTSCIGICSDYIVNYK